jgi:hypothetical protein
MNARRVRSTRCGKEGILRQLRADGAARRPYLKKQRVKTAAPQYSTLTPEK